MSLSRYEEYKDSGVAWLGEIPSHWRLYQARRLFEQRRDASLPGDEQLSATQKYGVIPQRLFMEREDQKVVLALSGLDNFKRIQPDDFVISLRSFQGGIERSRYAGCVSPAYTVLRPHPELVAGYWEYLLKSSKYVAALQTTTEGIRDGKNISYGQFGMLYVPLAAAEEQTAIAAFLDRETAKIDALVAEQEKLIALLAEKRQATISHAVTKGLDSNVPMKETGVTWLGKVPRHWSVSALSYLASIETGSTPDRGEPAYWNGSIPWLKTGEINWAPIREAEEFITEAGLQNSSAKLAMPGTLLMAMYGQGVTRGRVALLDTEAAYNQACAAIRFGPRISPEFGRYFFMAAYDHVRDVGNETSQMNLSAALIGNIRVPVPPMDEQRAVVRILDAEIKRLDALRTESARVIELLKERRSALIAAAVTGQIDVRGT